MEMACIKKQQLAIKYRNKKEQYRHHIGGSSIELPLKISKDKTQ